MFRRIPFFSAMPSVLYIQEHPYCIHRLESASFSTHSFGKIDVLSGTDPLVYASQNTKIINFLKKVTAYLPAYIRVIFHFQRLLFTLISHPVIIYFVRLQSIVLIEPVKKKSHKMSYESNTTTCKRNRRKHDSRWWSFLLFSIFLIVTENRWTVWQMDVWYERTNEQRTEHSIREKKNTLLNIYRRLMKVYGDEIRDESTVKRSLCSSMQASVH